jgi:hypothetical protein
MTLPRTILAALAWLALAAPAGAAAQTISQGQNGSGYYTIYQAYPNTTLTGIIVETNMAAIRIPANTLGPNGMLRITTFWTCTNSANNKTFSLRLNATSGAVSGGSFALGTQTAITNVQMQNILRNSGATNAQTSSGTVFSPYVTAVTAPTALAIDTTADTWLNINGAVAGAAETLTLLSYTIEVMHL